LFIWFGRARIGYRERGRRKEGKGREGWGVDTVVVITGGGIISIIIIIKLGPNIAAYEACITLFLIFLPSVWCWRLFAEVSRDEPGLGFTSLV
jgi:hypothetical protein